MMDRGKVERLREEKPSSVVDGWPEESFAGRETASVNAKGI